MTIDDKMNINAITYFENEVVIRFIGFNLKPKNNNTLCSNQLFRIWINTKIISTAENKYLFSGNLNTLWETYYLLLSSVRSWSIGHKAICSLTKLKSSRIQTPHKRYPQERCGKLKVCSVMPAQTRMRLMAAEQRKRFFQLVEFQAFTFIITGDTLP